MSDPTPSSKLLHKEYTQKQNQQEAVLFGSNLTMVGSGVATFVHDFAPLLEVGNWDITATTIASVAALSLSARTAWKQHGDGASKVAGAAIEEAKARNASNDEIEELKKYQQKIAQHTDQSKALLKKSGQWVAGGLLIAVGSSIAFSLPAVLTAASMVAILASGWKGVSALTEAKTQHNMSKLTLHDMLHERRMFPSSPSAEASLSDDGAPSTSLESLVPVRRPKP